MNKRGVVEDWGNLVVAIVFSIIILWFFGIGVSQDKISKDKTVQEKDEELARERFLIGYLRTPIPQTDIVTKNIKVLDQYQTIIDYASKNNLAIYDLFSLTSINPSLYRLVLAEITSRDSSFSKNEVRLNGILISRASCEGKTSIALIPVEGQNPVAVSVKLCNSEEQNE